MQQTYLSLSEAAGYLKISKSTLYKKTSSREIPFLKPGGKLILFQKSDLEDYILKNKLEPAATIETNFLQNIKKESKNGN